MLSALLIGCTVFYVLLAAGVLLVLRRTAPLPLQSSALPRISILVAARNEEDVLERCLRALQLQRYPTERIAFIIADDGSTDHTASIAKAFAREDRRFKLVSVPEAMGALRGKAHALHHAISQADGELLLITDADCEPPPDWAANMAGAFSNADLGILCGITTICSDPSLLSDVQRLDWLLLLTVAAGASATGFPITAMGNNMAVRRSTYTSIGGYAALPFSVTEDYALFRAIHEQTPWQVGLVLDQRFRNITLPLRSIKDVFAQRKRWARGGLDTRPWVHGVYALVYFTHLLPVIMLFISPLMAGAAILVKCLADLFVIRTGRRRLDERGNLAAFPLFELYLWGYVLIMPFALLLVPRTVWKGRRL
jgi:1,2-diacylglycerol 3-beta-glucosyltransferase